jgi:hypothetical protein
VDNSEQGTVLSEAEENADQPSTEKVLTEIDLTDL